MKKIKERWDFSGLYSGINDPKIEKDIAANEAAYASFAKKYKDKNDYLSDASKLSAALEDWKKLMAQTGICKPLWYLYLMSDIDTQNAKIRAKFDAYNGRITKAANQIVFFNLQLAKIKPEDQAKFLSNADLAEYKTYLSSIFEVAKYNLSENEEKILNLKHAPAHQMWVSAQDKLQTNQLVKHGSKMIPINQAIAIKADLPIKPRRALHKAIFAKFKEISFFAEAELNAVITNKRIGDELRGFTKPYEATVLGYQNSVKSVEALVDAVTKRFKDSNRFYKLKAKVLGLPRLTLAEAGVKMGKIKKKYTVEQAIATVSDSLNSIKPEFAALFQRFFAEGRFDVHPRQGKTGGAYCSGGIGVPTHILLNFSGNLDSVSTMAHEMGHAIHTELSKKQNALYEDYTISIAEVASTFFENVLFDHLLEQVSESERRVMLLEKIQDEINTVYSQIAYFNFEKQLHAAIKEKGSLSAAEMAEMFLKCRKSYFGPVFDYAEEDGYAFVYISHFRSFFYVYAYVYGQLIANALYSEYKKNPAFLEKIEYFLSAGSSKKPDDIFKDIGIDVTKPEFFERGLEEILNKIKTAERLCKSK